MAGTFAILAGAALCAGIDMLGSIGYGLHIQRAALLMRLALGCAAGAFLGSLSLGRLLRFRRLFRLGRLLGFGGHGALRRLGSSVGVGVSVTSGVGVGVSSATVSSPFVAA